MNTKGAKTAVPAYKKVLYGIGGIFSAVECAFVLLFLPYSASLGLGGGVLIVVSVLGLGLPVLCMPFLYNLINGATTIAMGRYHLPFVLCSLLSPLSCVLLFSMHGFSGAVTALLVFFLLFIFSLSIQVYFYTYYAIGSRLCDTRLALNIKSVFLGVGALGFAAVYLCLYDGSLAMLRNIVYGMNTAAVLSAVCVYLGTCSCMPFFIRVAPKTKRSVARIFMNLFAPLGRASFCLQAVGSMLLACGCLTALLLLPIWVEAAGLAYNALHVKLALAVMAVTAAVLSPLLYKALKTKSALAAAKAGYAGCAILLLVFALFVCTALLPLGNIALYALLYTAGAGSGLGVAVLFAAEPLLRAHFSAKTSVTSGRGYTLRNCMLSLSVAASLALTVGTGLVNTAFGDRAGALTAGIVSAVIILGGLLLWRLAFLPLAVKKRALQEEQADDEAEAPDKEDTEEEPMPYDLSDTDEAHSQEEETNV